MDTIFNTWVFVVCVCVCVWMDWDTTLLGNDSLVEIFSGSDIYKNARTLNIKAIFCEARRRYDTYMIGEMNCYHDVHIEFMI